LERERVTAPHQDRLMMVFALRLPPSHGQRRTSSLRATVHRAVRRGLFLVPFLCASPLGLHIAAPSPARAQAGEARVLFERGNQHLAAGLRGRGARRDRELQEALDAYLGVLRLGARTRNVVFNLGLVCQELGRANDAYNFYSE